MSLEETKKVRIQYLVESHQSEVNTGRYFVVNGKNIFCKKDIDGAQFMIQMMGNGVLPSPSYYWDKNLVKHSLTLEELQSLLMQSASHFYTRWSYCMGLVEQVQSASTIEQVNAITWTYA